jgi:hypothetical protein
MRGDQSAMSRGGQPQVSRRWAEAPKRLVAEPPGASRMPADRCALSRNPDGRTMPLVTRNTRSSQRLAIRIEITLADRKARQCRRGTHSADHRTDLTWCANVEKVRSQRGPPFHIRGMAPLSVSSGYPETLRSGSTAETCSSRRPAPLLVLASARDFFGTYSPNTCWKGAPGSRGCDGYERLGHAERGCMVRGAAAARSGLRSAPGNLHLVPPVATGRGEPGCRGTARVPGTGRHAVRLAARERTAVIWRETLGSLARKRLGPRTAASPERTLAADRPAGACAPAIPGTASFRKVRIEAIESHLRPASGFPAGSTGRARPNR